MLPYHTEESYSFCDFFSEFQIDTAQNTEERIALWCIGYEFQIFEKVGFSVGHPVDFLI